MARRPLRHRGLAADGKSSRPSNARRVMGRSHQSARDNRRERSDLLEIFVTDLVESQVIRKVNECFGALQHVDLDLRYDEARH
jgi:hypothetical protein